MGRRRHAAKPSALKALEGNGIMARKGPGSLRLITQKTRSDAGPRIGAGRDPDPKTCANDESRGARSLRRGGLLFQGLCQEAGVLSLWRGLTPLERHNRQRTRRPMAFPSLHLTAYIVCCARVQETAGF